MCLDYKKIDLGEIKKELHKWVNAINSNDIKDRVGQNQPLEQHLKKHFHILGPNMGSINTRHGKFIEKNFHKWVRCIPNWDSILRPKYNLKNPTSGETDIKEIDNISFNKKTGKLVIFELKRNYDTFYFHGSFAQGVYDRLYDYNRKRKKIINQVRNATGFNVKDKDCSIALLSVYGKKNDWHKNVKKKGGFDPEVYISQDLGKIFGQCLVTFINELDELMINETFNAYRAPEISREKKSKTTENVLYELMKSSSH
jgi:hypothetical protein